MPREAAQSTQGVRNAAQPTVTQALLARRSVRAFLRDKAVPLPELVEVIKTAHRGAPSGGNLQPWKVHLVSGAVRDAIVAEVADSMKQGVLSQGTEYDVYPPELTDPYRARRTKNGNDLYSLIGVPKSDRKGKLAHVAKNWDLFGAPVGLFFTVDRQHGSPQWADIGMFMQSIMLLCAERGWATCAQGEFTHCTPKNGLFPNVGSTKALTPHPVSPAARRGCVRGARRGRGLG